MLGKCIVWLAMLPFKVVKWSLSPIWYPLWALTKPFRVVGGFLRERINSWKPTSLVGKLSKWFLIISLFVPGFPFGPVMYMAAQAGGAG